MKALVRLLVGLLLLVPIEARAGGAVNPPYTPSTFERIRAAMPPALNTVEQAMATPPTVTYSGTASAIAVLSGGSGWSSGDVGKTITLSDGTVATIASVSGSAVATVNLTTAGTTSVLTSTATTTQASTTGAGSGVTLTTTYTYGSTLARLWPGSFQQVSNATSLNGSFFTYTRTLPSGISPYYAFADLATTQSTWANVSFYDEGTNLEIGFGPTGTAGSGANSVIRVKVDGQYVSLTPQPTISNSGTPWMKLSFGTRRVRRIDIIGASFFAGVRTDSTDRITPAQPRNSLRVGISGDSYCAGASYNFGMTDSFPQIAFDALGFDNVLLDCIGGTGWTVSTTLQSRFAADMQPFQPDLYIITLGRNDYSTAPATVGATVLATMQMIRAALPSAYIVVTSPLWSGGPYTWMTQAPNLLAVRDAIKANALAGGANAFVDFLSKPLPSYLSGNLSTTLTSNVAVGATTFNVPYNVSPVLSAAPGVVQIDSEVVEVRSVSYNTYTIDGSFTAAHASGATVTRLGDSFFSGHGNTSNPIGWGAADKDTGADNVHPTSPGHVALGIELANRLWSLFRLRVDPLGQNGSIDVIRHYASLAPANDNSPVVEMLWRRAA